MDISVNPAPSRLSSRSAKAAASLTWLTSQPRRRDVVIALLLALPVPLIMALSPRVIINYTHHDVFIPLDAAWRTLQGQWPHTDVYSPLGLAYFWMHGAAAWLWGMDGLVVIRANFVALPFVVIPALMVAWRRLDVLFLIALSTLLSVLVTAPTFIDGPSRLIAHLANYNRIGSGLCAVVCLWALCPPRVRSRGWDLAEAIALGVVLLILLYLKVTFFALALATVIAGCCSVKGFWRSAAVAACVVIAGMLALEWLHPGLLSAYIADVRRAGAASTQLFRGFYAPQALFSNALLGALVLALAAATVWIAPKQRWAVLCLLAVAAGCVLVSTQNFGAFSPPLVALTMILAQRLDPGGPDVLEGRSALAMAGVLAVALTVVPFVVTQAVGAAYQLTLRPSKGVVLGGDRPGPLHDVVWMPNAIERAYVPDEFTAEEAVRWQATLPVFLIGPILNDGLDLLRRDGLDQKRIANLSFSNPFPVALKAPPPRGVALWWDEDRTFRAGKVSAEAVLGDADVVMVPKLWFNYNNVSGLLEIARHKLEQDFQPHESEYWTAWVRK